MPVPDFCSRASSLGQRRSASDGAPLQGRFAVSRHFLDVTTAGMLLNILPQTRHHAASSPTAKSYSVHSVAGAAVEKMVCGGDVCATRWVALSLHSDTGSFSLRASGDDVNETYNTQALGQSSVLGSPPKEFPSMFF